MVTWANADKLASWKKLLSLKGMVSVAEELSCAQAADRIAKYSIPMGGNLTYNYAAKQVNEQILKTFAELAEEQQLDLVNIAPTARPPVCKLMDYGKYRFEMSKKEREIKKNQKIMETKEVRLSATIEDHDIDVRYRQAVKFLQDGNKLKVTIRFRGRQIAHSEIGNQVMQEFAERIKDYGTVERRPVVEGRNMTMMVAPRDAKKDSKASD